MTDDRACSHRRSRSWNHLTALVLVLAAILPTIAAPMKIMPLGDSRTAGPSSRDCYRKYLHQMMTAEGYSFDFVGTATGHEANNRPPDSTFDFNHQGMWGWTTQYLLANPSQGWEKENIGEWARLKKPDMVLALLGTTDLFEGDLAMDARQARLVQRIERVIDTLRVVNPGIIVLLANLYPVADSAINVHIAAFNPRIPEIATKKNSVASPVLFVDTWTGFNQKYELVDWLHANGPGCTRLAQRWLGAMWPFFDSIPPVSVRSPGITPERMVPLRQGHPVSRLVGPSQMLFSLTGRAMPRVEGSMCAVGGVRGESPIMRVIIAR